MIRKLSVNVGISDLVFKLFKISNDTTDMLIITASPWFRPIVFLFGIRSLAFGFCLRFWTIFGKIALLGAITKLD